MNRLASCMCYLLLVWRLNAQNLPDTDDLRPINCQDLIFDYTACGGITPPFIYTNHDGSSYPDEGFCIVKNTLYNDIINPGESASYRFSGALCGDHNDFGGGIFFNFQDNGNYDTFHMFSESTNVCIVGHVENGIIIETGAFTCKTDTTNYDWLSFEVTASQGYTVLSLKEYGDADGLSYAYTSHFRTTPNAGPLHINDPSYHEYLHFADFDMTILEIFTTEATTEGYHSTTEELQETTIEERTTERILTTEEVLLTTRTTTTEDTTDVPSGSTEPLYQIRMEGDFVSSTGADFSQQCITSYSMEMDDKVVDMRFVLNSIIGSSLCTDRTSEEVQVVKTSGLMSFDGGQGVARPSFSLELASHLYMSEIEACVAEVTAFLLPHSNWGEHVVVPVEGCPEVNFVSNEFNSQTDIWVCTDPENSEDKQQFLLAVEPLRYGMGFIGEYYVEGGEDLVADCQSLYSGILFDNTETMVSGINNPDGTHICGDLTVQLSLNSAYLSGGGGNGISLQDYILELSGDMSFSDVYACADSILAYLSPHSNWMDPIIPQLPGCPRVFFSPEQFDERFQQWICVAAKTAKSSEEGKKQANPDVRRENTNRKNMARLKMKKLFQSYLKWD